MAARWIETHFHKIQTWTFCLMFVWICCHRKKDTAHNLQLDDKIESVKCNFGHVFLGSRISYYIINASKSEAWTPYTYLKDANSINELNHLLLLFELKVEWILCHWTDWRFSNWARRRRVFLVWMMRCIPFSVSSRLLILSYMRRFEFMYLNCSRCSCTLKIPKTTPREHSLSFNSTHSCGWMGFFFLSIPMLDILAWWLLLYPDNRKLNGFTINWNEYKNIRTDRIRITSNSLNVPSKSTMFECKIWFVFSLTSGSRMKQTNIIMKLQCTKKRSENVLFLHFNFHFCFIFFFQRITVIHFHISTFYISKDIK